MHYYEKLRFETTRDVRPDDVFVVTLPEGGTATLTGDAVDNRIIFIELRVPVDKHSLVVFTDEGAWDKDGRNLNAIKLGDADAATRTAALYVVQAIGFLLQERLRRTSLGPGPYEGTEVRADCAEDEQVLAELGLVDYVWHGDRTTRILSRSFLTTFSDDDVSAVMLKSAGVLLFSEAERAMTPAIQFLGYWKVLESGFGEHTTRLVELLVQFEPAQHMAFDLDELRRLRVLRGRAAHAYSSAGLREIVEVGQLCDFKLARLRNLAERVLLTKRHWGTRDLATDERLKLAAYVDQTGGLVIFKPPAVS